MSAADIVRWHLSRSGRSLLVLLVVAALAVPVVQAAERLRINVDGDVLHVLTFEPTVAEALDEQGVELAAGDQVLPAMTTPLGDVSAVTVLRTIDVTVDVDGQVSEHRGTWRTVAGLLADIGVSVDGAQVLRPGPRTVLEDGDVVTITSPRAVTVVADGATVEVETHLDDVAALLPTLDLALGADDRMAPGPTESLRDGLTVRIERVAFEDEVEEVVLPFTEETRDTDELYDDESRVAQEGAEGLRVDTYRVEVVDGDRVGRELVSEEVVTEPVARIVEQGTAERPPPPPPPPPPPAPAASAAGGSVWYELAQCESGGNWAYDGASGYDGGLQFHPDTWRRNKPAGYPEYAWQATPDQQIEVGRIIQSRRGWGAWPSCAARLGLS